MEEVNFKLKLGEGIRQVETELMIFFKTQCIFTTQITTSARVFAEIG